MADTTENITIFHGTNRAYDTINLPTGEYDPTRNGRDEYGVGFYTAHDPHDAAVAQDYASRYINENNQNQGGVVLTAELPAGQWNFLNFDHPVGEAIATQTRQDLSTIASGDANLDRYYHQVAGKITPDTTGKALWKHLSESDRYQAWHAQEQKVTVNEDILRSERKTLGRALTSAGIDTASTDPLTSEQVAQAKTELHQLSSEQPELKDYYTHLADGLQEGTATGKNILQPLYDTKDADRFFKNRETTLSKEQIHEARYRMDQSATTLLEQNNLQGLHIPADQTIVFKGQAAIDKLPDLHVTQIVNGGPSKEFTHTDRPVEIGKVLVPSPQAKALEAAPVAAVLSAPHTAATPEASHAAPTPTLHTEPSTASVESSAKPSFGLGMAGAGLALGTYGLVNAHKNHDTWGTIVSGTNVAASTVELAHHIAPLTPALKTALPALETTLKIAGKANVALTVADGVMQIAREDGAEHKAQRTGAVVATAGTGMLASAAGAGVAGFGVAGATVTAGTVAVGAGVIAAPMAIGFLAEKNIEVKRMRDDIHHHMDAVHLDQQGHANLHTVEHQLTKQLDAAGVTKDAQGKYDAHNETNAGKIYTVMQTREHELETFVKANKTLIPTIREKEFNQQKAIGAANVELKQLHTAETELTDEFMKANPQLAAKVAAAAAGLKPCSPLMASNLIVPSHDLPSPTSTTMNKPQQQNQR